ncbi:MAG: hypothetical protein U0R70_18720 [Solirubrobacteraceae bacterium]
MVAFEGQPTARQRALIDGCLRSGRRARSRTELARDPVEDLGSGERVEPAGRARS